MDTPFYYENLTACQLKMLQQKNAVILFSLGSIEQHSSHLPVGTDYLCSKKRVEGIAARSNSVIFSPLQLGYSFNHSSMFSTISLSAETLMNVLRETFLQLCEQGWKRFLIFSGHAGNWGVLEVVIQKVREKFPHAQFIMARGLPSLSPQHDKTRFLKNFDQHAGVIETALISYYYPELLDKENIPQGNTKLPDIIKKHISSDLIDEIDALLIKAYTPQKTEDLSLYGHWGIQNPNDYAKVPVGPAMKRYEDYFVKLISRWDKWESEK